MKPINEFLAPFIKRQMEKEQKAEEWERKEHELRAYAERIQETMQVAGDFYPKPLLFNRCPNCEAKLEITTIGRGRTTIKTCPSCHYEYSFTQHHDSGAGRV